MGTYDFNKQIPWQAIQKYVGSLHCTYIITNEQHIQSKSAMAIYGLIYVHATYKQAKQCPNYN